MKLSLFTDWNNITTEWLFNYLKSNYPLNFKLGDKWYCNTPYDEEPQEIQEIKLETKKVICRIHKSTINLKEFTMWNNPVLVHFYLHKTGGNYQGYGFAVNNMPDFEKGVKEIIVNFNKYMDDKK